jgi:hypothetical protein
MPSRAELEEVSGLAWHSLRRKFATELRDVPLTDLHVLGGLADPTTLLTCYQQPDAVTVRRALEQRRVV